ncbi:hypothetical protein D9V30_08605 [Mycetocola reblochoni]|uniref:histidine kinase n=2 Tax=Mycetocola reblochoni TaxID=331618 RepID=A0A1R4I813_9MICO|nr:ATP-binding protein [Mycetocola reblochoni]RLP68926.1 hypothetical protein D9V30_08605 [Mycetocola reblochoni]SJN15836.1 putative two-component system sensor kinase [Mycetocola reblochoni REB411]
MRGRRRVRAALTAALLDHGVAPELPELVGVVGSTLRADSCAITLGSRTERWLSPRLPDTAGEPQDTARLVLQSDPLVVVELSPSRLMPERVLWQPLLILVAPLAVADGIESSHRAGAAAARRLADVRWRASTDMEHERRRLERDLHDGAQHHLVALRMAIALAEHRRDEPGAEQRLAALRAQLDEAERLLLATARGVLPRVLAAEGLGGALRSLREPGVVVDAEVPRVMPAVESALYFIALEAISNALKYAPGATVTVTAAAVGERVRVVVADDGPGFAVGGSAGGLAYLAERLAAIGGELDVVSAPGEGTVITASAPR